jgi:hypothetical protein
MLNILRIIAYRFRLLHHLVTYQINLIIESIDNVLLNSPFPAAKRSSFQPIHIFPKKESKK